MDNGKKNTSLLWDLLVATYRKTVVTLLPYAAPPADRESTHIKKKSHDPQTKAIIIVQGAHPYLKAIYRTSPPIVM